MFKGGFRLVALVVAALAMVFGSAALATADGVASESKTAGHETSSAHASSDTGHVNSAAHTKPTCHIYSAAHDKADAGSKSELCSQRKTEAVDKSDKVDEVRQNTSEGAKTADKVVELPAEAKAEVVKGIDKAEAVKDAVVKQPAYAG